MCYERNTNGLVCLHTYISRTQHSLIARAKQNYQLGKWILAKFSFKFYINRLEKYKLLEVRQVRIFRYIEPSISQNSMYIYIYIHAYIIYSMCAYIGTFLFSLQSSLYQVFPHHTVVFVYLQTYFCLIFNPAPTYKIFMPVKCQYQGCVHF